MGEYFWAGLIAGLFIWVLWEVCFQLFRRAPFRKAGAASFAVLHGKGHMEEMEYLLRRTRALLQDDEVRACRIFVIDDGMDEQTKNVVLRFEGAKLCAQSDLGPAVTGVLPPV